jgi:SPP1 gp7 family putative phage head morphogenesis protein
MARIPSAERRRRLVRPVPDSFAESLHGVYSQVLDLIKGQLLESFTQTPRDLERDFVRVDSDPATLLDLLTVLLDLFSSGLPADQARAVRSIFDQMAQFADKNVRRSLPGIAAETLFPQHEVRDFQLKQLRKIQDAAAWQIGELDKVIRENRGVHPNDLRKLIQEKTGASKGKAKLWARDQVLKFNAEVTKNRHQSLGIEEYVWTTSRDERVRDRHRELADRKFRYDDPPLSKDRRPINPGEDYQCRCIAFPVTPSSGLLNQPPDAAKISARQARAAKVLARRRRQRRPPTPKPKPPPLTPKPTPKPKPPPPTPKPKPPPPTPKPKPPPPTPKPKPPPPTPKPKPKPKPKPPPPTPKPKPPPPPPTPKPKPPPPTPKPKPKPPPPPPTPKPKPPPPPPTPKPKPPPPTPKPKPPPPTPKPKPKPLKPRPEHDPEHWMPELVPKYPSSQEVAEAIAQGRARTEVGLDRDYQDILDRVEAEHPGLEAIRVGKKALGGRVPATLREALGKGDILDSEIRQMAYMLEHVDTVDSKKRTYFTSVIGDDPYDAVGKTNRFLDAILHKDSNPGYSLEIGSVDRSYANPSTKEIQFVGGERWGTLAHEMGHAIEEERPPGWNPLRSAPRYLEAYNFLTDRTEGERAQKLADLLGIPEYGEERAKPDKFIHPYVGKQYKGPGSEIMSTGLERVSIGDAQLIREDPDMFHLVMSLVRS